MLLALFFCTKATQTTSLAAFLHYWPHIYRTSLAAYPGDTFVCTDPASLAPSVPAIIDITK